MYVIFHSVDAINEYLFALRILANMLENNRSYFFFQKRESVFCSPDCMYHYVDEGHSYIDIRAKALLFLFFQSPP